ncbi:MAG TPA: hypothetical protein VJV96_17145 [Candidatus Angelobacter sp.]|nr:hypothetical protein [Candidatus Angelobacter sp.]
MNGRLLTMKFVLVFAMVVVAFSTPAVGQKPQTEPPSPPRAPSSTPRPSPAPAPSKLKVDCTGQLYAATFCSQLQQFFNALPADALNADGTLNTGPAAVQGVTVTLIRPDTSPSLWIQAVTPTAAVNDEAKAYAAALLAWESARLDKQKGATQTAAASTDMVAKPGASGLLSLASETGAFASTVNGSSVVLDGNPWNAFHLMTTGSLFEEKICSSNCVNPLRTTNIIAAFTVDQSKSTTATTNGAATSGTPPLGSVIVPTSSSRLSSITARWNFWHSLDPASSKFQGAWNDAFNKQLTTLQSTGNDLATAIGALATAAGVGDPNDAVFAALQKEIVTELEADYKARNARQLVLDYESYLERFVARCRSNAPKNFDSLVLAASASLSTFKQLNQQVIDAARGTPILTAEYTFSRPANQPYTHDVRLIAAESWKTGAQVTANLAVSVYATVPSGAAYGRLKDAQLSAQYDQAIGNKSAPPVVVSFAGYGQYQWDPSVLNITSANLAPGTNIVLPPDAQQFLGTSGWLGIVQAKATIQLQKTISIPLAVKWSNKTELLNAQDVRGQFGINYDFGSLIAFLKGQ